MNWDIFNGDADGLCAVHQFRLAEPAEATLVTGAKREIELLARVSAQPGDCLTVFDISLDRNRAALMHVLAGGARVRWFDHHYPGELPAHPLFDAHIDTACDVCSSMLVDRYLGGRFRAWAVVAAYGDGLPDAASALAESLHLSADERAVLRDLGEDMNYNAYGESASDLAVSPAVLYRALAPYTEPLRFAVEAEIVRTIRAKRNADMALALAVAPYRACARGDVYTLPDTAWSRRVGGTLANHLASAHPARAHAVLTPDSHGNYGVSIRAPRAAPSGAVALARAFPTGGGREAAAGIDRLPAAALDRFIEQFANAW